MQAGVYKATKKDGSTYYRVSITYRNKHISLGSFEDEIIAGRIYTEAWNIIDNPDTFFMNADNHHTGYENCIPELPFHKYITLVNFRDNNIYIKTPIYLCQKRFLYFLSDSNVLTFSTDDLFYYSNHTIMTRGGYYFVNDYGIQTSILSRYGIRNHSVKGKDYIFKNGDENDFTYENVMVINQYNGVSKIEKNGRVTYKTRIHINGDYTVGEYQTENEAAVAYNKACDLVEQYSKVRYTRNFITAFSSSEYKEMYNSILLNKKLETYVISMN